MPKKHSSGWTSQQSANLDVASVKPSKAAGSSKQQNQQSSYIFQPPQHQHANSLMSVDYSLSSSQ